MEKQNLFNEIEAQKEIIEIVREAKICNTVEISHQKKVESVKEVFLFYDNTNCGRKLLALSWEMIKEKLLTILTCEEAKNGEDN